MTMQYQCLRCLYSWFARSEDRPIVCPKCHSPYWDKPRGTLSTLKSMNNTERRAYKWLSSQIPKQTITFQHSTSPDFLTQDGKGYEVKRFLGYKIHLNQSQWENLVTLEDCWILVFNENVEPLEIIPLKGKTPPFNWGAFHVDVLPDPLANYKRHLEILNQVAGKGLKGKQFWDEYRRIRKVEQP